MKLKVGDVIEGYENHNKGVIRKITGIRKTGYTWEYLDVPDRDFISEDSCDPFFDFGWKIRSNNNGT